MPSDDNLFITGLVNTFPNLKEELSDEFCADLIHLQVAIFARFTQKAIDSNNIPAALKCFEFVEQIIDNINDSIKNALIISWVIHLTFIRNENMYARFPADFKAIRSD